MVPAAAALPQAVILVYHRFGEDDVPATNVPLALFDAQLDWLVAAGAHFAGLEEILAAFATGAVLPDFTVAVTADDAYASIARNAWPRLKARGIPFTLFVATDAVDRGQGRYLDWDGVRALARNGVVIGHHGAAHAHMAQMDKQAARADIERANARFQAELGRQPTLFAYPYGEYAPWLAAWVRDTGFDAAFAQFSSVAAPREDRFVLPRFAINLRYGALERFRLIARARALPVAGFSPADPWLGAHNPPAMHLVLAADAPALDGLNCYASTDIAPVPLVREGRTVRLLLARPFAPGRGRVNCTAPAGGGRWYWFGRPVFVAPDAVNAGNSHQ